MDSAVSLVSPQPPTTEKPKRLFLVEDHPLFRAGLMAYLETEADLAVAGQAATADEALAGLRADGCDCVILDLSLPGSNGLDLLKRIRAEHPGTPILVVSMHDESQYALRALQAGAQGYVTKRETPGTLLEAVRTVLDGEVYVSDAFGSQLIYKVVRAREDGENPLDVLTARELEILRMVGEGNSSQMIATALGLSVKTVESHRLHIKEKLRLPNASELVRFATEWRGYERPAAAGQPIAAE